MLLMPTKVLRKFDELANQLSGKPLYRNKRVCLKKKKNYSNEEEKSLLVVDLKQKIGFCKG